MNSLNKTLSLIRSHRSVRSYKDDPVPADDIQRAVEAGQAASTSSAIQSYCLLHITRPAERCGGTAGGPAPSAGPRRSLRGPLRRRQGHPAGRGRVRCRRTLDGRSGWSASSPSRVAPTSARTPRQGRKPHVNPKHVRHVAKMNAPDAQSSCCARLVLRDLRGFRSLLSATLLRR